MKLFKFFEYVYLILVAFSIYVIASEWNQDRRKSYLFIAFGLVTLMMFFFRRYYRMKFEKQKRNNQG